MTVDITKKGYYSTDLVTSYTIGSASAVSETSAYMIGGSDPTNLDQCAPASVHAAFISAYSTATGLDLTAGFDKADANYQNVTV